MRCRAELAVAHTTLERWRKAVRSALLSAEGPEVSLRALRGLAAWYERMCVDSDYHNPPPQEGLGALVLLGGTSELSPRSSQLASAHKAIRLAQELAACRAQWHSDEGASSQGETALTRLELALHAASEAPRSPASR